MPVNAAVRSRMGKCPWLETHSDALPSALYSAPQAWGKILPRCTAAVSKLRAMNTSASARPTPRSPMMADYRRVMFDRRVGTGMTLRVIIAACSSGAPSAIAWSRVMPWGRRAYPTSISVSAARTQDLAPGDARRRQ